MIVQCVECEVVGGDVRLFGCLQYVYCVVFYVDVGKVCGGKVDCNGQCFVLEGVGLVVGVIVCGVCQCDISQNFGCYQCIDNGVVQGMICVD